MRLTIALLLLMPGLAQAQVWEKLVTPGVVYRMEVDLQTPRVVHALRIPRDSAQIRISPGLAQGRVYGADDDRKGREALSETLTKQEALAGINGDFFPWTGDPLGALVRDGELVSRPFAGRSVFAWGKGMSTVARVKWSASASFLGHEGIKVDGLNEQCSKDMVVLNTPTAGYATSDAKSFHAVFEFTGPLLPNGTWTGKVVTIVQDETRVPVGPGQAVLSATGKAIEKLQFLAKGEELSIKVQTTGLDFKKAPNVIGGGPVIVSDGKPIQAWDAENFNAEFASKRHPRTAIGTDTAGDIWLVVVEGRQAMSVGATIEELSNIMLGLGCVQAVNLDGGGSSELSLSGMIVNRPSDGAERPIADSILVFTNGAKASDPPEMVIQGRPRVPVGSAADYRVIDDRGQVVPSSAIVWSASGDAWVDQGGRLRTIQPGQAVLNAWVGGRVVSLKVTVEAQATPP